MDRKETVKAAGTRLKLVVTGDDFGYCPRRNQGMVECFLAGGISNMSLLVNGSAARDAAHLAKRHHIPLGLHANLSEGKPVSSNLQLVSTLINQHGFFHGKLGFRQALQKGHLDMKQVEEELRNQVEMFVELIGHRPLHMDGHQHVHVLPVVRQVFAQVLFDFRIPYTRVPVEKGSDAKQGLSQLLKKFYKQVEKDAVESVPVFQQHGLRWPDVFLGLSTMGQNMSVPILRGALQQALNEWTPDRPLTAEFMVHPGYPSQSQEGGCGQGPDDFSQSADRLHELNVLRDPGLLNMYTQENIQLCSFTDL